METQVHSMGDNRLLRLRHMQGQTSVKNVHPQTVLVCVVSRRLSIFGIFSMYFTFKSEKYKHQQKVQTKSNEKSFPLWIWMVFLIVFYVLTSGSVSSAIKSSLDLPITSLTNTNYQSAISRIYKWEVHNKRVMILQLELDWSQLERWP